MIAAAAKSLQLCPTLWDPIDGSPPGSAIPGILQARTLEWVAISFSNAWKWKVKVKSLSPVWLLVTPWTTAYQAPLSMGFSRQEYCSGMPLPSPKNDWDNIIYKLLCVNLLDKYYNGLHNRCLTHLYCNLHMLASVYNMLFWYHNTFLLTLLSDIFFWIWKKYENSYLAG